MTHGSLFSGIGGFDLAAEWAGWDNIFHCEWNEFGQKVLKHHFPKSISYNDITKTDFSIHRGHIDILTGGFPCQPYSTAGLRKGKEDERHLFPEMLRCIKEVQPRWIVGENVRGLVSWNEGMVFHEVYDDLEREGYEVQSFLIPAAGVGAPHQRYRVWFVAHNDAYSNRNGQQQKWGYDRSSENVNGGNNEKFGTTNTKNLDGCGTYGNTQEQFGFGEGFSIKGVCETDKASDTRGACRMDKNHFRQEGFSKEVKFKHNESRTLVQDGQSGVQLSDNRGLEFIENALSSTERLRLQNDIYGVDRMERNDSNSNRSRLEANNTMREPKKQKFSDGIISENDATNPISGGMEGDRGEGEDKQLQATKSIKGSGKEFSRVDWEKFPTKSPICGGDDGIPRELDSITFSKWRNESIKAYGNAIVPQVAYQIFSAINEFEKINYEK